MFESKLYVRVVSQDRGRGWLLLASWDKPVVQRTCVQMSSFGDQVNQVQLDALKIKLQTEHRATKLEDVTAPGILAQLAKQFKALEPKEA